ncbi:AAA-domain-containing protein [Durotheca rogersii]|uniref:AAA-domain-containing protein n=1 Tax=Durotheca rogersii TaxID=419775 RepID=UPI00221FA592|nr:AAA-domain-containing protein [Durotheca rogersii]KAI5857292.1 AAA-domain-containing protein [Durotheca rogersii]
MWPSRSVSGLQKTYDEAYLKCSTAVYYESQSDEKEAMLCWRNALDQIQQNSTTKRQMNYHPKSETERALLDSLQELEVQCKERIDLLEALRMSRQDDTLSQVTHAEMDTSIEGLQHPTTAERGWIGNGTIPAITYTELSKPPLPKRPMLPPIILPEPGTEGLRSATIDQPSPLSSLTTRPPLLPSYGTYIPRRGSSRTPSPEKHIMKTTLRSNKSESPSKLSRHTSSKVTKGLGASKAATLAWGSLERVPQVRLNAAGPSSRLPGTQSHEHARKGCSTTPHWDSHTRRLVVSSDISINNTPTTARSSTEFSPRILNEYSPTPSSLALGAASSALGALAIQDRHESSAAEAQTVQDIISRKEVWPGCGRPNSMPARALASREPILQTSPKVSAKRKPAYHVPTSASKQASHQISDGGRRDLSSTDEEIGASSFTQRLKGKQRGSRVAHVADDRPLVEYGPEEGRTVSDEWVKKKKAAIKNLPMGIDELAAKAIFNEIVVQGDEVHWSDVAGLDVAKTALREAVVYPFLRPDLFLGLREPARGMLLFGPPGTGKTMLARAVATESKSTFFSISASSLTSKYLGESEKLVRALFALAKTMAPSIIFVDEIDSLLSQRSGSGEHEATRRIKTEFLIQWSDLQRAAAGRESTGGANRERGDANRVLVLAATNLPWAIDEAARRRFVRRQYIPLPEGGTRATQLKTLLGQQKHNLTDADISKLVTLTDGFSGSDITALAKDAAMGPLRSLGEALLHMTTDQIRAIEFRDFEASLRTIRPSVSREGLQEYEDWARQFGERGG